MFNILDGKAAIFMIDQLPKKYQKVLKMFYVEDMTITEIAEVAGIPKNSISVLKHRGLKKLKLLIIPVDK